MCGALHILGRIFFWQACIPFHVGGDYAMSKTAVHITTESLPTSQRFSCPHANGITAHIDRNPQDAICTLQKSAYRWRSFSFSPKMGIYLTQVPTTSCGFRRAALPNI